MPRISDADQRLMAAALELIWGNSYGSTSVDAICEKAGVKKGSFYYFFQSKSDLAVAALEADWNQKKPHMDALFSPTTPPLDRLRNYFDDVASRQAAIHKQCGSVLGCPLFSIGSEVCIQDKQISSKVQEIFGRYLKYFESAIRDAHASGAIVAPKPATKARLLFALYQGILAQARIQNCTTLVKELTAGAMELLGAGKAQSKAA